jgi:septum formation topological specificity factor MinE
MKNSPGNRGFVQGLLLLFVLVAVVFVGLSFGKPYFRYHTLSSHTSDFLKSDVGNLEVIKKHVMDDAAELQVPLDEKNLEVVSVNKVIKVKATWSETVDFWGYYTKKLDFVMEEEY